jgi:hypothetical protein
VEESLRQTTMVRWATVLRAVGYLIPRCVPLHPVAPPVIVASFRQRLGNFFFRDEQRMAPILGRSRIL